MIHSELLKRKLKCTAAWGKLEGGVPMNQYGVAPVLPVFWQPCTRGDRSSVDRTSPRSREKH